LDVKRAILEGGVAEQVRRPHADAHARLVERRLEARDDLIPLARGRAPRDQILVVQADAPGAELAELLDRLDRVEGLAGRPAERVAAGIADGPETEREAGLIRWGHGRILSRVSA
jgi:hypothetical protein